MTPLTEKFDRRRAEHAERNANDFKVWLSDKGVRWVAACQCGSGMDPKCAAELAAELYADGWAYAREMDKARQRAEAPVDPRSS